MKRNIGIALCSMVFGLGVTGCLVIPKAMQSKLSVDSNVEVSKEIDGMTTMSYTQESVRDVAWWSVMYETPNPEQLPVQVHFQWLKGLE